MPLTLHGRSTRVAPAIFTASPTRNEPHILISSVNYRPRESHSSCKNSKDMARAVLQGVQQQTLSSTQEANDKQGKRSAQLAIWTRQHERRASLT